MKKMISVFVMAVWGILLCIGVCSIRAYSAQETEMTAYGYDINGYSIAYCENDQLIFQNYGDGIDEKSVFELASNGKVIGAYIALQLVDEGQLDLEYRIAPFLDDDLLTYDKKMYDITLRQLLCHTAGFSPSFELGIDKKIYTDPGETFCYSGVGYIYLQNVIENVSGMTMEQAAEYYVFEPLEMNSSTFEYGKTVTPYMNLSSIVLYMSAGFMIAFIVILLIGFVVGKITKFRFFSFKSVLAVCFLVASIMNMLFLLFIFVSKVAVVFGVYAVFMGVLLFFTYKKTKIYYLSIPIVTVLVLILGFTIPASLPVTNDLVAREPNCAYTLKSTSEDMSRFCRELMRQYHSGNGAVNEMFSEGVSIDEVNSWGLGIAVESGREGTMYWHSGINPGFQSLLVLYPLQDKYVIVLTNSDNGLAFSKEIAKTFLKTDGCWEIKRQRD